MFLYHEIVPVYLKTIGWRRTLQALAAQMIIVSICGMFYRWEGTKTIALIVATRINKNTTYSTKMKSYTIKKKVCQTHQMNLMLCNLIIYQAFLLTNVSTSFFFIKFCTDLLHCIIHKEELYYISRTREEILKQRRMIKIRWSMAGLKQRWIILQKSSHERYCFWKIWIMILFELKHISVFLTVLL